LQSECVLFLVFWSFFFCRFLLILTHFFLPRWAGFSGSNTRCNGSNALFHDKLRRCFVSTESSVPFKWFLKNTTRVLTRWAISNETNACFLTKLTH
jgi:hypothetical protein